MTHAARIPPASDMKPSPGEIALTPDTPVALDALGIAPCGHSSTYPQSIQAFLGERLAGREKRALGDAFGLTNFGVNLTRLAPDAVSALRHAHSRQDELIYILAGSPTLLATCFELGVRYR